MSADYQKGRYDELVERHQELLQLYKDLKWDLMNNVPRSGVSGGMVNYQEGLKINPKVVGGTLGGTGIAFSLLSFTVGLEPVTFGVTLAVFGLLYGVLGHFMKVSKE